VTVASEREAVRETPLFHFCCAGCSYRASCRIAPERCPLCGGSAWEYQSWRPFTSAPLEPAGDLPLSRDPFAPHGDDGIASCRPLSLLP
jgi:hypothetical protein